MRILRACRTGILITALCLAASGQNPPGKDPQVNAAKGLPPRATPADYQAQARAGTVTVAAEFAGHSVPTPEGTFATEDYVVVEMGFFGPPEARLKISVDDFSLRINKSKTPLPSQPFGMVLRSLKDPEWAPPVSAESKSSSSLSTGGTGGQNEPPPAPVHMPFALQRAMEQRVQKAALPDGDRTLPLAGLVFFPYHGKPQGIHTIELIYIGPAGKATLALQP